MIEIFSVSYKVGTWCIACFMAQLWTKWFESGTRWYESGTLGALRTLHMHTYIMVHLCVLFLWYIYFLLHDLKALTFSILRLYATGLGNVSVFWHEITYIWQCCFFVHLSRHCFMLDVLRLYATGLGNASVFWHEVIYIWQCCFFVHLSRNYFILDVPRLYTTRLDNIKCLLARSYLHLAMLFLCTFESPNTKGL
jgi:hypothetical protein